MLRGCKRKNMSPTSKLHHFALILSLVGLYFSYGLAIPLPPPTHPLQSVVLDAPEGSSVVLSWETNVNEITFDLAVRALGYVAIGISRSGGMSNSDMAIGWVTNDDKTILQDRFSVDKTVPRLDKKQDLKLISSHQNTTHTRLVFSRKFDTGDAQDDVPIPIGDVHVIYAYTDTDPVDENNILYHGPNRGVKTIKLRP